MNLLLPEYVPPHAQRAATAVGLAPIVVLLAFTLIVCGLIEVDTGFAVFAACTAWVVYEMHQFQKAIDGYNEAFVARHLSWRSTPTLQELAGSATTPLTTREFIARFLDSERMLLRDGQLR
jgi:hypothetical protein